ncbi:hypothetical protein PPTG_23258 [Phytophthora nicotianae INRA-310]|uniref:Uncharacterized protein n=1 Tax=Phytophthora nicotianae (strain INRA-310) TaxID=761204 RepID=W2Q514_PHYN3|nr:hypothetical protein PPTG_23258 [Phytophthora nicotianae INRA-310]ETN07345.1 hypothetical protein PPTG_23258 [Phytophthora nicotianae INRA-310]
MYCIKTGTCVVFIVSLTKATRTDAKNVSSPGSTSSTGTGRAPWTPQIRAVVT